MQNTSKSSVYINIGNRALSLFGSVGLLVVVLLKLTPEMQGFYYTFYSLVFLRFFAELGLSFAIVQIISHEDSAESEPGKLAAFTRFFVKWYVVASCVLAAALLPAILLFQNEYAQVPNALERIVLPWAILALATAAGVFLTGMISIIEGRKQILAASKLRLAQSLGNVLTIALCLMLDLELWSLAIGATISALVVAYGIVQEPVRKYLSYGKSAARIDWKVEIWPFQWRLAMSWASGFLVFYVLTPLVMKFDGPVAAGQVGISFQIFQAINSIAILYISTHSSVFGGLVAEKKLSKMTSYYIKYSYKSSAFLLLLLFSFFVTKLSVDYFYPGILGNRLVGDLDLLYLAIASIGTHIFFMINYYLRSFKNEDIWPLSLFCGLSTIGLAFLVVPAYGASSAIWIFLFNSVVFWVLLGVPYFLKIRRGLYSKLSK